MLVEVKQQKNDKDENKNKETHINSRFSTVTTSLIYPPPHHKNNSGIFGGTYGVRPRVREGMSKNRVREEEERTT